MWNNTGLQRCFTALLVTVVCGGFLGEHAGAKQFLGINLGPTPSEFPTRSFRDNTAADIAGSLLLKYNASEARMVAAQWFEAARQYLPSLAENNPLPPVDINVAIANSFFANVTEAAGKALAAFLPDHLGKDSFKSNYSQAFIPGIVTGLKGIRYEPCLLRSSAVGAAAAATGLIFNPTLFEARPTGAALTATGLRLSPALLLIAPSAAPGVAFGGLIAPSLITVVPTHVSIRDTGFQANPSLIKINSSPNVPLTGPGAGPSGSGPPSGPPTSSGGEAGADTTAIPDIAFNFPNSNG